MGVCVLASFPAGDDGSCEVAEDPWAKSLDGVYEGGGEEHVDEGVFCIVVIEEGK